MRLSVQVGVVCICFVLANGAWAQEKEIRGSLVSIDPEVGAVVIHLPMKGEDKAFSLLKKDIPVSDSAGGKIGLDALKKKHRVALVLGENDDVAAIRLESNLDWGVIINVDAERGEFVANLSHSHRTVKLSPKVRMTIDGSPASDLKEVKAWSHGVKVLLTPDRTAIQEMWLGKGKYHANPYCHRSSFTAFLTDHDPVKKTLSLITTDRYQRLEFEYDSWTQLKLTQHYYTQLRDVPISQLRSPAKVNIGYDTDNRRVSVITLDVPTMQRRRVAAIDPASRKLSLEAGEQSPAEDLVVAADAKIYRDGKLASPLTDVQVGSIVSLGLTLDQKEVLYLSFSEK